MFSIAQRCGRGVLSGLPSSDCEGRSVLLAEDNKVNQLVAVRLLEQRGFRVDVAPDGREAVRMHQGGGYDVIFMDCQMPELDGYAATGEIRLREERDGRHTPIVAMTANTLKGDRERCLAAGMDDYLGKPLQATDLEKVIAHALAIVDGERSGAAGPAAAPLVVSGVLGADPSMPLLDVSILGEVFEDDEEGRAALMTAFRTESRVAIDELTRVLETGDAAGAERVAHTLKASSAAVGAARLSPAAGELGRILTSGGLDQARAVQTEFEQIFDLTDGAVRSRSTEAPR